MKTAILISTWNRRHLLEATLRSLKKTVGDFDIFVIDDGSTDGTHLTMDEPDENVTYIRFRENRGLRWVLNYGLQKLGQKYDFITYNQDDVIFTKPNWLQECITVQQKYYKAGFVTCHEAPEHPTSGKFKTGEINGVIKPTARMTHLFAHSSRWKMFGEIPVLTPDVAAPKMGSGSKVDWWLMGHDEYKESKYSIRRMDEKVYVLPGRLVHIGAELSTWGMINPEKWVFDNDKEKTGSPDSHK